MSKSYNIVLSDLKSLTASTGLQYLELSLMLAIISCYGLLYVPVGYFASHVGIDFSQWAYLKWDDFIPFNCTWIYVYWSIYLITTLGFILLLMNVHAGAKACFKGLFGLFLLNTFSYVLFILFPVSVAQMIIVPINHLNLPSFSAEFYLKTFHYVSYWNSTPSLHVSMSYFMYCLVKYYLPSWRCLFFVWFVAIALSTLFIKIHYLVDVITGILLAQAVFYCLVYKWDITQSWVIKKFDIKNRIIYFYVPLLIVLMSLVLFLNQKVWNDTVGRKLIFMKQEQTLIN